MNKGFWEKLKKPVVGLSPMDGVTDAAWRFIAKKYGEPDVIYTEFVSAEGLWRIKKRNETDSKIWKDLLFDRSEHPVVAQLFGSDPASFFEAAKIIAQLGFDGVDINMGCPSPGLEKRGGGAGLMRNQELARQVIEETRRGVEDRIPVSVKTRIGSDAPDEGWWNFLASMNLPVVAMHGRTFKQLYSGFADWEVLKRASKIIRNENTLFLANGDVNGVKVVDGNSTAYLSNEKEISLKDFDGVLIGRAAMGNPWVFRKDGYKPSIEEKLKVAIDHSKKYEEIFSDSKFFVMRKHLAWYAHGFSDMKDLRRKLVLTDSARDVEVVVREFLEQKK